MKDTLLSIALACLVTVCTVLFYTPQFTAKVLLAPTVEPSHWTLLMPEGYLPEVLNASYTSTWELVEGIPKYTERSMRLHL